jgi:hypothetical protein
MAFWLVPLRISLCHGQNTLVLYELVSGTILLVWESRQAVIALAPGYLLGPSFIFEYDFKNTAATSEVLWHIAIGHI